VSKFSLGPGLEPVLVLELEPVLEPVLELELELEPEPEPGQHSQPEPTRLPIQPSVESIKTFSSLLTP